MSIDNISSGFTLYFTEIYTVGMQEVSTHLPIHCYLPCGIRSVLVLTYSLRIFSCVALKSQPFELPEQYKFD